MKEKILKAIEELRKNSKKRNFPQTFDVIISLKEFDAKKPENRFVEDIVLPHGRGEEAKIVVFSDTLKNLDCDVLSSADVEKYSRDKRGLRKLVKDVDFFLAEAKMMSLVGKVFGQFIGPRGKLPKIIAGDAVEMVKNHKKSVRIKIKDSPVIQCPVGNENMKDEQIVENIETIIKLLETKLPKGIHNIKSVLIKLTMSKPVKVEV
jgi:large subunit ribosomal protein L1